MKDISKSRGFTLIELMIVVVVVGVLAAIAYPGYLDSIRQSRRTDAQAALMAAAQHMEAYYARNGSYADATLDNANISNTSPEEYYTISIVSTTANSYTLQAVPTSKGGQDDDDIQGFRLSSTGAKTHTTDGSTYSSGWE